MGLTSQPSEPTFGSDGATRKGKDTRNKKGKDMSNVINLADHQPQTWEQCLDTMATASTMVLWEEATTDDKLVDSLDFEFQVKHIQDTIGGNSDEIEDAIKKNMRILFDNKLN